MDHLGSAARELLEASGWLPGGSWPPEEPVSSPFAAFSEDTFPYTTSTPLAIALAFSGSPDRLCGEALRLGGLARSLWVEVQLLRSMLESRRAREEHMAFIRQEDERGRDVVPVLAELPLQPQKPQRQQQSRYRGVSQPPPPPQQQQQHRQPARASLKRPAQASLPSSGVAASAHASARRRGGGPAPPPPPPSRRSTSTESQCHPLKPCSPITKLKRGEGLGGGKALLEEGRAISQELRARIMGRIARSAGGAGARVVAGGGREDAPAPASAAASGGGSAAGAQAQLLQNPPPPLLPPPLVPSTAASSSHSQPPPSSRQRSLSPTAALLRQRLFVRSSIVSPLVPLPASPIESEEKTAQA
jgi:hypothetical protein